MMSTSINIIDKCLQFSETSLCGLEYNSKKSDGWLSHEYFRIAWSDEQYFYHLEIFPTFKTETINNWIIAGSKYCWELGEKPGKYFYSTSFIIAETLEEIANQISNPFLENCSLHLKLIDKSEMKFIQK